MTFTTMSNINVQIRNTFAYFLSLIAFTKTRIATASSQFCALAIINTQIIAFKQMSINAMGSLIVCSHWASAPHIVFTRRYFFNVARITTRWITTQVVALHFYCGRLNKQGIVQSVSQILMSVNTNKGIPFRVTVTQPARRSVAAVFDNHIFKNTTQRITGNNNFAIIESSHSVYSYLVNGLVRVVEGLTPPSRPVFIVP